MPRLAARESLDRFAAVGAGTGSFKGDGGKHIVQGWGRLAERPSDRRRRTVKLTSAEDLRRAGIRFTPVKRKKRKQVES